jgi:hypothetical protein
MGSLMDAEREIVALLKANGFILVRHKKHHKDPQGHIFVVPNSPSDRNWVHHSLATLRRMVRQHRTFIQAEELSEPLSELHILNPHIPEEI